MATHDTEDRKRFTLRLSPELYAQLAAVAEREHRSLNEQIVWILERYLVQQPHPDTEQPTRE